jgi:rfaE bifunctional protein nucleotidyltransferase chain/domain
VGILGIMTPAQQKIRSLDELTSILHPFRGENARIVHCHGVFDLLHIGHIRYLEQAKKLGDVLVVTLTSDRYVQKGPNRPAFSQSYRAEAIAALGCVDFVAVNDAPSAVEAIQKLRPSHYVKGKDYKDRPKSRVGNLSKEEEAVLAVGGELVVTDEELFSSSALLNHHFSMFSDDITKYLETIRSKYSIEKIEGLFDAVADLKVLVIGETIVDEYQYCEAIGKSGKEPVLVTRQRSSEKFGGGVLAVANHVAGFCKNVSVLSFLGSEDSHEAFVRSGLRSNVTPLFMTMPGRPTIVKKRYVEHYLLQKLFEIYVIEDEPLARPEEEHLLHELERLLPEFDLVIVADYGHGMLSPESRARLCSHSRFLAVNTQVNAGNNGFHTISCYPRADYISISYGELCLEMRKRFVEVEQMLPILRERVNCDRITITQGKAGICSWSGKHGIWHAPALTQHFVDRVGSGDAVLSLTSPFAAIGVEPDLLAFMGNLAGAEAVKTVGHRSFLERRSFVKQIRALMK